MAPEPNIPTQPRLISVVIPVFKAADKLPITLESLASQGCELWEAIVRDGSPDSEPGQQAVDEFLKSHPSASVRFIGGPDKGVYDAMNSGIEASTGRYLYFLGSGDTVLDGAFAQIAEHLEASDKNGQASVVYGNWLRPDQYGAAGFEHTWYDFARKRNINHQAMFFSRGVFKKLGGYELRYPVRADNIMNIRIWGDKSIVRKYVPISITMFEGGGLSDTVVDKHFHDDFPGLVSKLFGLRGIVVSNLSALKKRMRNDTWRGV